MALVGCRGSAQEVMTVSLVAVALALSGEIRKLTFGS